MIVYYVNNSDSGLGNSELEINEGFKVPVNKFEYVKNEIDRFTKLENNWDGYSGAPVIEEIAEASRSLFLILGSSFIDKVSDIFPNPHGTISIEWENRKREKLSLELGKDNYSYFINYLDQTPKLTNGLDIFSDIENLTSDLGDLFSEELQKYFL